MMPRFKQIDNAGADGIHCLGHLSYFIVWPMLSQVPSLLLIEC